MRHPVTNELYAYWNRLRGARAAPDRSEIEPAAIRHVLADTFIIEVDRQCMFPIRLCGTRLNALWLAEQKGRSFLDIWREDDRRSVAAVLLTVIDGAVPVVAGVGGEAAGHESVDLELLLLPLRHFGKTHSRVLGSLAPVRQPSWLGLASMEGLRLRSMRVVYATEGKSAHFPVGDVFPSPTRPLAGRPRLVVYDGGG
ncbi:MAG: PAS domain-containing protein [Methylocystis sp.]|nr:PAS domain-containing protein [Methylocystis sp.]